MTSKHLPSCVNIKLNKTTFEPHQVNSLNILTSLFKIIIKKAACSERHAQSPLKTPSMAALRIGFIGAGNMAQALAKGFISSGES